jgi:hypothetical protein
MDSAKKDFQGNVIFSVIAKKKLTLQLGGYPGVIFLLFEFWVVFLVLEP